MASFGGEGPPCRFFAQGTCRNGAACKFSHAAADPALASPASAKGSAASSPASSPSGRKPCRFYAKGECKNGAACNFSHGEVDTFFPEPDYLGAISTNFDLAIAIDVECVATGTKHNDRAVAQIGIVSSRQEVLLNVYIKPSVPVVSYMTPLTGLTKELIDKAGIPLEDALAKVRAVLPATAVLVGTNIAKDSEWLRLREGTDFASLLDLSALFRAWEPEKQRHVYFGQDHIAKVWLGAHRLPGQSHDAVGDASISMALFHAYASMRFDPQRLAALRHATLITPREPSFAMKNPTFEGVCQGNRKLCKCGAAHFT